MENSGLPKEIGIVKSISEQRDFTDFQGEAQRVSDLEIQVSKPTKRFVIFACFNDLNDKAQKLAEGEKVAVEYLLSSARNKYKVTDHKVIAKSIEVVE